MNHRPFSFSINLLAVLCLALLSLTLTISIPGAPTHAAAQAADVTLSFNSLPSAQGWTYSDPLGNLAESAAFSVPDGKLHQTVYNQGIGPVPHYELHDVISVGHSFTLTVRARVAEYSETNQNPWGFSVYVFVGGEQYALGISPNRVVGGDGGTDFPFSFSVGDFHDYRMEGTPGSGYQLFVDNNLLGTVPADSSSAAPGANYLQFGDGTGGAAANVVIEAFTFTNHAAVPTCPTFPYDVPASDTAALINAINCANTNGAGTNDVINLASSSTYTLATINNSTDGDNGLPVIVSAATAGTLTINGNGATIERSSADGTPSFRFFQIAAGSNLTLDSVTLHKGKSTNVFGGAIYNEGTLTVSNSLISDNSADENGGGILSEGTLSISNSTFSHNSTNFNGGGIALGGDALTLTIMNTTFSDNSAIQGGGGILSFPVNTQIKVTNSTFSGNSAGSSGGAIDQVDGTLLLSNSTFSGNSATIHGGNIYSSGTLTLNNTIIANSVGGDCFGNPAVSHTLIEDGSCGVTNGVNGNLTGDPNLGTLMGSPAYFPLNSGSIAINVGDNTLIPVGITTDEAGNPRISDGTVDLGAFEFSTAQTPDVTLNFNALPSAQGWTYADAGGHLSEATAFSVSNGMLHQTVFNQYVGATPAYELHDVVTVGAPFTLTIRAKVTQYAENNGNPWGFVVYVFAGGEQFVMGISPNRIVGGGGGVDFPFDFNVGDFHDYRMEGTPGHGYQLFVDNNLLGTVPTDTSSVAPSANYLQFGDGTQGARADVDIEGFTFTNHSAAQPTGTISGHVHLTDGVTPASASAFVGAFDTSGNWYSPNGVNPVDGSYTIHDVPAGDYRVLSWDTDTAQEFYDEAGVSGDHATIVTVGAGENVTGIDFTLDPGGTISGTVKAADGVTPLVNAFISTDVGWFHSCSDADGHYTLENLPLNTPIRVVAGGSNGGAGGCGGSPNYVQEWWQESANQDAGTPITLSLANRDVTGTDFTLDLGGSVSGHVYETDNETPPPGFVWVSLQNIATNQSYGNVTSYDGSYIVGGVPPGNYRVRADDDGFAFEFYDEAGTDGNNATTVTVTADADHPGINFTLDPGGTISGTVKAADGVTPLVNMRVNIDGVWVGTCTDANGQFTLTHLPLNVPLTVNTGGSNWCAGGSQDYQLQWWQNASSVASATPVTLTLANRDTTNINFTLANAPVDSNLITNGDFSNGETAWGFVGQLSHTVSGQVLTFNRTPGAIGDSYIYQDISTPIQSGHPFQLNLDLSNSSSSPRRVDVAFHNVDWNGGFATCTFYLAAGSSLRTHTLQGVASADWSNPRLQITVYDEDSSQVLGLDNVSLTDHPELTLNATNCVSPDMPLNGNSLSNGGFDSGLTNWGTWPDASVAQINSGVLTLSHPTSISGVTSIFQAVDQPVAINSHVELTLDMGNSSSVNKRMVAVVRSSDWSDFVVCPFLVPAHSSLQTYTLRGRATQPWAQTVVEVQAVSADNSGGLQVDNLSLHRIEVPEFLWVPECNSVTAPANQNLVRDGSFDAGLGANGAWSWWGGITLNADDGQMHMQRQVGAPGASIFQFLNFATSPGMKFDMHFDLSNSTAINQTIALIVRAPDWSAWIACPFTIPANSASATYTMQGVSPGSWSNMLLEVQLFTESNTPGLTLDNASVVDNPALSVTGTTCGDPHAGGLEFLAAASTEEATVEPTEATPVIEPTEEVTEAITEIADEATSEVTEAPTVEALPTDLPTALPFPTLPPPASPTDLPTALPFPTLPPAATDVVIPEPTLTPTAAATPIPFSVPLYQTMDDGAPLWSATSGWQLGAAGAFGGSGLGWTASVTGQLETLRLQVPIDLRTAHAPQLSFQSRLASASLPELQISLDGSSWQTLSVINASGSWTAVTLDLAAYTGQVVYIQFVWLTPGLEQAQVTDTWQVDDLTVADAPATAVPISTPTELVPTEALPTESAPTEAMSTEVNTEPFIAPTLQPTNTPTDSPTVTDTPAPEQTTDAGA